MHYRITIIITFYIIYIVSMQSNEQSLSVLTYVGKRSYQPTVQIEAFLDSSLESRPSLSHVCAFLSFSLEEGLVTGYPRSMLYTE